MRLTKCENKHFYDADKHDSCPHCEETIGKKSGGEVPPMDKPVAGNSGASALNKGDTPPPRTGSPMNQRESGKTVRFDEFTSGDKAPDIEPSAVPAVPKFCGSCGAELRKGVFFCGACGFKIKLPGESGADNKQYEETPVNNDHTAIKGSLQSQVNAVVSHSSTEDVKTVAFYDFADTEPVVGWLVCVKGEYFGQSFNLKTGQNFIGRALNMDIPLAKDTGISRNRHAIITYDPQSRMFFIQPGESNGLTYLNNGVLLAYQPLEAYEKIKVGNSEFIFVPCCGKHFAWENYI